MGMRAVWVTACVAALLASSARAETLTVVVKEAAVKKQPYFYAPSLGTVHLGEHLESTSNEHGWHQVPFQGATGWLHDSAVTTKKFQIGAAESVGSTGTTADEVTIAGKGFNEQVEQTYRHTGPQANFSAVDAMERSTVSDAELRRFVQEGSLSEGAR
jgi:hypothetical protein